MFWHKANSELVKAYEARIVSLEYALAIERARVDRLMESVADKAGITVSLPAPLEPVKVSGDSAATPMIGSGTTDSSPAMPDWWRAVAGNNKIATPPKSDKAVESQQEKKQ